MRGLAAFRKLGAMGVLAFLLSCSDRVAGGSSETESGTAVGALFRKGGAPVQGARVTFFPAGEDTGKAISVSRTTLTDVGGVYRFDSLAFDTYNMTAVYVAAGTGDTLVASNLRIEVSKTMRHVQVGADTLRGPGAMAARVLFQSNPVEEALCYVPGTSYIAITDSAGRCLVSGISPGRYRLSFKADGYRTTKAKDTVQVATGDTVPLGDVELQLDENLAPPKPNGLSAAFDTSSRKVTLTWSKVPALDLEGYALFRDSVPAVIFNRLTPDRLVKDTFYVDSLPGLKPGADTLLAYRIKAQDKSGEQSRFGLFDTVRVRIPGFNLPPSAPFAPRPLDSSAGAASMQTLQWKSIDSDGDSLKADIHFGKENPPMERIARAVRDSFYVVSGLDSLTPYYWRISVTDGTDTVMGPVWSFKTAGQPPEGWKSMGPIVMYSTDMHFIDKNTGWIASAKGEISRTPDGGATWFPQNSGVTMWLGAIQFVDSLRGWAVGEGSTILRTVDGGANWAKMPNPGGAWYNDLFFLDALHGWVVGTPESGNNPAIVLKTDDGGTTWTNQTVGNSQYIQCISFLNADTGYLAGAGSYAHGILYKTVDGGRNWDELDSVGIYTPFGMHFVNVDTGWVGGATPGQKQGLVAGTVDGGKTWTVAEVPGTTQIQSVGFQDGMKGWASGDGVHKTLDGGKTWQRESVGRGDTFMVYFNLDREHGWAAGYEGELFKRPPLPEP